MATMYVLSPANSLTKLTERSHHSTHARRNQPCNETLHHLRFPSRTESLTQRPSPLPACPSTHHSPIRSYSCSSHCRSRSPRSIAPKLHPLVHLQRQQAPCVLRTNNGSPAYRLRIDHFYSSYLVWCKSMVENPCCSDVVYWIVNNGRFL